MKKTILALILITGFSSFALSFDSVNIGHHGAYVWRGITLVDRPVNQGDISFSHNNFGFTAWWNYDVSHGNGNSGNEFTKIDYTLNYSTEINGVGFEGGFIYYDFPNDFINSSNAKSNETREFYLGISLPYIFNPTFTIYHDINEARGIYYSFSFSEDFQVKFKDYDIPLSISTNIGFNSEKNWNHYYKKNSNNSGISNIDVTFSSYYDLSDDITIKPYVTFSSLLNEAQNGKYQETNLWVGVNLSVKF